MSLQPDALRAVSDPRPLVGPMRDWGVLSLPAPPTSPNDICDDCIVVCFDCAIAIIRARLLKALRSAEIGVDA